MKLIEKVRLTAGRLKTMARRPPRKLSPQKLQARVRAAVAPAADAYDDDEPHTKLTSAFVVVLILHVVAVGGIYAFNQIKASRRSLDAGPSSLPHSDTKTSSPLESGSTESNPAHLTTAAGGGASAGTLSGPSRQRVYNVKPGDTLIGIAKMFGTTVTDLKAANSLPNDGIRQGQVLNLPSSKPVADTAMFKKTESAEPKLTTRNYTVRSGDRLIFIAKKYNTSQEELMSLNKITDPGKLQIGQTLKIPAKK